MDQINIFDKNFIKYGTVNISSYDLYFIDFIKKNKSIEKGSTLLDVGGGSGTFANLAKANCPEIYVTVIDPSEKMLSNINNPEIKKLYGSLPNDLPINDTFDYIHIKEVLHHITGQSPKKSKEIVIESLNKIKNNLKDDGYLFIHEIFYEGYVISILPRTFIFYALSFQNKLGWRIPQKDFVLGLQVCFYTRSELESIFEQCGFDICERFEENIKDRSGLLKKIMLLDNWGRVLYILRKGKI